MKKILTLVLIISLLTSTPIYFAIGTYALNSITGTCGNNLSWCLDKEKETLTIKGVGKMYDYIDELSISLYNGTLPPWYNYLNEIENVILEEGGQSIGRYAFHSDTSTNSAIKNVSLPSTLTLISENAFSGCT